MTDASIIVGTRNRSQLLRGSLESLLADGSATSREVIVVDNGSTDDTRAVVESFAATRPDVPVRYVLEPRVGLSHARNKGVAEAVGDILIFADDDLFFCDGWLDELVTPFADETVGMVGGRIVPLWPEPPPAWLAGEHATILTGVDQGEREREYVAPEHPFGANMAVRASLARTFDPPFDPDLGHSGDRRIGWEEVRFTHLVQATHRVVYRPSALVHHRIESSRINLGYLRRAFFQLGMGQGRLRRLNGNVPALPRRIVRTARAWRSARELRRANHDAPRTGASAEAELAAYRALGIQLASLFGRSERLTDYMAVRLYRGAA